MREAVTIHGIKWEEGSAVGDVNCPICGAILIIMATIGVLWSFCFRCNKYFIPANKEHNGLG